MSVPRIAAHKPECDQVLEGGTERCTGDAELARECHELRARMAMEVRKHRDVPASLHEADQGLQVAGAGRLWSMFILHLTDYIVSIKIEPNDESHQTGG